jgi:DNA topoisomerase-1
MQDDKWKYAQIENIDININDAYELLSYPKNIGLINNIQVTLNKGKYGNYIKYGDQNISIKDDNINIDQVKKLISENKSFKIKDKTINIKSGNYGAYLQIVSGKKTENINIPKKYNVNTMTIHDALQIIVDKRK